ncbi:DUF2513 domain-containing protein [Acinetobacter johnsonii]|jgi:hypothetical protein|uniref:DUF2513 domain-containing protein n=1 Tax=Acinetobacter TaxID=469 RepID=UPI001449EA93|nr:DUF2513 domain-containing protein [Acinetobacter sp. NEB149]QJB50191.1 DUF2513 domain-containing protein [Acinetobacter sp. NEB149]
MKRDWEIIRQVLISVEEDKFDEFVKETAQVDVVIQNSVLLLEAGFLKGSYEYLFADDRDKTLDIDGLTWKGHELLDTIRSKPVWDKIKSTALDKGLELTFDAVKLLGAKALALVVGNLG